MRIQTNIIAFICGLLLVAIFTLYSLPAQANNDLTAEEEKLRTLWLTKPEQRDAIEEAYWKDINKQIQMVFSTLPKQLSDSTVLISTYLQKPRTIVYEYWVHPDVAGTIEPNGRKQRMANNFCEKLSNQMYFEMFQGSMAFVYYIPGAEQPFETFVFEPDTCKTLHSLGA